MLLYTRSVPKVDLEQKAGLLLTALTTKYGYAPENTSSHVKYSL